MPKSKVRQKRSSRDKSTNARKNTFAFGKIPRPIASFKAPCGETVHLSSDQSIYSDRDRISAIIAHTQDMTCRNRIACADAVLSGKV